MRTLEKDFYQTLCNNNVLGREKEIIVILTILDVPLDEIENMDKNQLCYKFKQTIENLNNYGKISSKNIWKEIGITKEELANIIFIFKKEQEETGLLNSLIVIKNYVFGNNSILNPNTYYRLFLFLIHIFFSTKKTLVKPDYYKYYGDNFVGSVFSFFGIPNPLTNVVINIKPEVPEEIVEYFDEKKVKYSNISDKKYEISYEKALSLSYILTGVYKENAFQYAFTNYENVKKKFITDYRQDLNDILLFSDYIGFVSVYSENFEEFKNSKVETLKISEINCISNQLGDQVDLQTSLFIRGKINGLETVKLVVIKNFNNYYVVQGTDILYILRFCKPDIVVNCIVMELKDANLIRETWEKLRMKEVKTLTKKYKFSDDCLKLLLRFQGEDLLRRIEKFQNFENFAKKRSNDFNHGIQKVANNGSLSYISGKNIGIYNYIKKRLEEGSNNLNTVLLESNSDLISEDRISINDLSFPPNFFRKNLEEIRSEMREIIFSSEKLDDKYVVFKNNNNFIPLTNSVKLYAIKEIFLEFELKCFIIHSSVDFDGNTILKNFIKIRSK